MASENIKAEIITQLEEYRQRREECERIRARIRQKHADITDLKETVLYHIMRHDKTIVRRVELVIETMNEMTAYYGELLEKREKAERRVMDMLEKVQNGEGRKILYLHYIEGVPFKEVSVQMGMSDRTMWSRHKAALEELRLIEECEQMKGHWEENGEK